MTAPTDHLARRFRFERDTFAFAHELLWKYHFDPVTKAMTAGKWMEPDTEMGQMFSEFAKSLIEKKAALKEPKKFLEFLSTPNRLMVPTQK